MILSKMKSLSILLIEDDEIERMKFKRICENNGFSHTITEAHNGEVALEKLEKSTLSFDIIILDLNMPKMNGLEFLKILKNDEALKYIPTIIMSTSSNYVDLLECYKIGIAGYFIKPLHFEDYSSRITSLLEYWSYNELIS